MGQEPGQGPLVALSGLSVAVKRGPRGFCPRNESVRVTLHSHYISLSAGEERVESPGLTGPCLQATAHEFVQLHARYVQGIHKTHLLSKQGGKESRAFLQPSCEIP